MKYVLPACSWLLVILILAAVNGCGSNPNVEGARFDLRNKDYQRALTNIHKALETEPNNSEALLLKGDILAEMLTETYQHEERTGYIGELAGAYAQALMLDPRYTDHITDQRSRLYTHEFGLAMEVYRDAEQLGGRDRANQFAVAADHFRNASMMIPDSVNALINEAHAYYNAGKAQEAVDAYETALGLGHTDRELFIYLARTYELIATELAEARTQPGYYRQIVRTLNEARAHHPEDEEIRKLLLHAYAMSDLTSEALPFYEEIYPKEKQNQVFLYNYGTLLLNQQAYEAAIPMLASAVALDSSYMNARFNLGAAYVNQGVAVNQQYQAASDSLNHPSRRLAPQEVARLEARITSLETFKAELFGQAIPHLESARQQIENDLGDISSICHALYIAYAQTNQKSRAEEASICAKQ